MANLRYYGCKFRAEDRRAYTYHYDGPALAIGAEVKVADKDGEGWVRVTVESATDEKPPFATKPILGLAPKEEPANG